MNPLDNRPTFTAMGCDIPLHMARTADCTYAMTEWLNGLPATVVRCRTEMYVPAAWAELWMLNRVLEATQ